MITTEEFLLARPKLSQLVVSLQRLSTRSADKVSFADMAILDRMISSGILDLVEVKPK